MASKLGLIIKREYLAKVRNRSFIVMTILSPILIVGMIVLIAFLTKINDDETRVITILNESTFYRDAFKPSKNISFLQFNDLTVEQAKDSTNALEYYGLLHIPEGATVEEVARSAFLFTKDNPNTSVTKELENVFQNRLRQERLQKLGVTPEQFSSVEKPFEINLSTFDGERSIRGVNEIKAIIGGSFGYAIMMFIIIYGGFVMRSVIEEKTSRIIEVIISSVKPFQLMLGKIIGNSLAGVTQFSIWIVSASALLFVAVLIFGIDLSALSENNAMPPNAMGGMSEVGGMDGKMLLYAKEIYGIPWGLLIVSFFIYFVLGYLIYSSIYAAIGAAVDNETDTQQFIFPIILPLMLAIYVGFFSVFSNPHGPIAVGFSLFPLTSPIVMLMRLPGGIGEGGVPLWQFIVSISLLIVTFLGIVSLAAKIYRTGILMYGKKPTYKELFKWLRYK
ncbi:MAG: ABC transporter permease [Muricauda sp.]|jgi:ABC-2 type transport system permease protein|uniref:ABC transporter permease n=1 Tax=Flagellimonas sp. MMG031 TaxID=3158549 RepID=A0AAU7MXG4_9FLAO|nr:ABC transporter permease [Allomuricauda sp.]MBO6533137.1 ABC transporter permease [Allomuricauda sp.]MBO6588726.1 ABC transporter permease [Allomuricauda sp.]MBO6618135.1 ABC transporter permease [Allomuricauda sp.]MBO6644264.1 ABC transporter permease [Allomuricauda sp.]MBO6747841.1 ABC transporter permease [Allomuricauda sp.]